MKSTLCFGAHDMRVFRAESLAIGSSYRRFHIDLRRGNLLTAHAALATEKISSHGSVSIQGSSRKQNEDRLTVNLKGDGYSYAGVFDGHGGYATADWLQRNLEEYIKEYWDDGNAAVMAISEAFLAADRKLLAPKGGFFGSFGERGVGGSKCGATGVVAMLYDYKSKPKLLAANVGDSRAILIQGSSVQQLTLDHVPDLEEERLRIEDKNPNPKMPLVRYVGGTWRTGGLLALSRAFGDAFMKGSLQFEGPNTAGSDGYGAGFGVIAEPTAIELDLTDEAGWIVLASDGLFANDERGGGGGLSNEEIADFVSKNSGGSSPTEMAQNLAQAAQKAGSTDDITVVILQIAVK